MALIDHCKGPISVESGIPLRVLEQAREPREILNYEINRMRELFTSPEELARLEPEEVLQFMRSGPVLTTLVHAHHDTLYIRMELS